MRKVYDLAVKTGEYEVRGQRKNRWANVGAMWENDRGEPFVLLHRHFNPAGIAAKEGQDCIAISCFKPKDRDGNSSSQGKREEPAMGDMHYAQQMGFASENAAEATRARHSHLGDMPGVEFNETADIPF